MAPSTHQIERTPRRVARVYGLAGGLLAGLLLSAMPTVALAQSCISRINSGFAQLPVAAAGATSQAAADATVQGLFGPRPDRCEDGAYRMFLESFKEFSRTAMRATPALTRDKQLRLAISLVQQVPLKVPAREVEAAVAQLRQVKSDLGATADEVGLEKIPVLRQFYDALLTMRAPAAAIETATIPVATPTTPSPQPTANGNEERIRVPTQPLPPWAVIKLYEMRYHIKAQDLPSIQLKLQEVINWMEASTREQQ